MKVYNTKEWNENSTTPTLLTTGKGFWISKEDIGINDLIDCMYKLKYTYWKWIRI